MIRCVRLKKPTKTCAYCFDSIEKTDSTYTSRLYVAHRTCEDARWFRTEALANEKAKLVRLQAKQIQAKVRAERSRKRLAARQARLEQQQFVEAIDHWMTPA